MQRLFYRRRLQFLFLFVFLFLCLGIVRLGIIQFFHSSYLSKLASKQHNTFLELEPRRGTIYDANLKPLAVNVAVDSVYATPSELSERDKAKLVRVVPEILGIDRAEVIRKLSRKKAFVWLARKITTAQSQALKTASLKGIGFIKESKRCYPNGYLASHVLGFAGLDNSGLEGLELQYDHFLRGSAGWALFLRDARQKKLDIYEKMMPPVDGFDLVLTIDEVVQYIAEKEIDRIMAKYPSKAASIIVMEPSTGQILAMANRPSYDLNEYKTASMDERRNRAICDLFEPGSVFKIVTATAALSENKVAENDRFFCENGEWKYGPHILHDHQPHGWLTFKDVIAESSNIGTAKVAQKVGSEILYRYIKLFGFGEKSEIDLRGEISGIVRKPGQWSKTSMTAVPMGQEVGVTSLQLVSAISAIANGGQLMRPYVVKSVNDRQGQVIKSAGPAAIRRVMPESVAQRMRAILTGVVEHGTGTQAKLAQYRVAGKTGTAQKLEPNGSYSHNKFVASFIGFVPADDPRYAIAVVVDEPRPVYYGGVVSAPAFKNIAEDILGYYRTNHQSLAALNETKRIN